MGVELAQAAILLLLWVLEGKMMMMKAEGVTLNVSVASGSSVLLTSGPTHLQPQQDVRWTHRHLVVSLKNNRACREHGRCFLLGDGSLHLTHATAADAGHYRQEMFSPEGELQREQDFLLIVENSSSSRSSSSSTVGPVLGIIPPLLLFIILIFLRIMRRHRTSPSQQENEYMVMHGNPGNKTKDEEEEEKTQEESHYGDSQRTAPAGHFLRTHSSSPAASSDSEAPEQNQQQVFNSEPAGLRGDGGRTDVDQLHIA